METVAPPRAPVQHPRRRCRHEGPCRPWTAIPSSNGLPWRRVPPPPFERTRLPDPLPRRDRFWRRDAHIAIDEALTAGELPLLVAAVLRAVLSFSDDRGSVVWAGLDRIGQAMGGRSARTAGRWLAEAKRLGWVLVEPRCSHRGGRVRQLTNLTLVVLPPEYEAARRQRKAAPAAPAAGRETRDAPRPVVLDHDAQMAAALALADLPEPVPAPAPPGRWRRRGPPAR